MRKQKEVLQVMKGKANHDKAQKQVQKARADAIKELTNSENGFAVFYVRTDKKGNSIGVQTIMAGAMGIQDTVNMGMAMKDASEKMVMGMLDGLKEQMQDE